MTDLELVVIVMVLVILSSVALSAIWLLRKQKKYTEQWRSTRQTAEKRPPSTKEMKEARIGFIVGAVVTALLIQFMPSHSVILCWLAGASLVYFYESAKPRRVRIKVIENEQPSERKDATG